MQIGPYVLICELACGGMGQVWLALRVWPDGKQRPCVIKLPRRSAVADEASLWQFVEETRVSILLRHDNIVSVFDVGVHEGLPYLVMDYIPGVDLAQLVRAEARLGSQWSIETAVQVVRAIAQGLHYAHEFEVAGVHQQIVHRDVASKNVMVDGTGAVLLMDFGVATSIGTQTSRIHAKGTLRYMAPEHLLARATTASDVFGLGCIFWELLAGRPFRGDLEGEALRAAVVAGAVEPVGRELPSNVRRVLDGMLHPDADQRIKLPVVLTVFEDFPSRRLTLKKMVQESFGPASRRTGHSQLHFVASKELVDTLAIVKLAGISLPEPGGRMQSGQPDHVPADFTPIAGRDTAKVDLMALAAAANEVEDRESGALRASMPSQGMELMGAGAKGGTLRSHVPERTANARSEPTLRLPGNLGAEWLAAGAAASGGLSPTAFVAAPAPPTTDRAPRPAEPAAPVRVETQRVIRPHAAAAGEPMGAELRIGSPSPPVSSPPAQVVAAPTVRPSRSLVVAIVMLLVGLGIGVFTSWPGAGAIDRTNDGALHEADVAAHIEPSAPMQAPPERSESPAKPEVTVASPAPNEPEDEPVAMVELHARAGAEVVGEPRSEQEPPLAKEQPPRTEQGELPSEPAPAAAKPKPRPPKPAPKLEVTIRRGLVGYAELKLGNGKAKEVPARGALTLRVAPGTYTLRFRTSADGAWTTIRYTFSAGMEYAGRIEQSGLSIGAVPRGAP